MANIVVLVQDQAGNPVQDALVEYDWFWTLFPQHAQGYTDNKGNHSFEVGMTSATVKIKASKGLYFNETTVQLGWFTIEPPNPQKLVLFLAPLQGPIEFFDELGKTLSQNAQIAIVVIGVPFAIAAAYFLYRWISTGAFIGTAAKVGAASASAVGKTQTKIGGAVGK